MTTSTPSPPRLAVRLLTSLAAALLLSTASCGDAVSVRDGLCQTDADCASGLRCHAETWCVAVPTDGHDVVLRMAPPPGSSTVMEHFEASFGGAKAALGQTWQLTEPAVVRGTVLRAGDALSASIPGRLTAIAGGKTAGTTLHYEATSYHAPKRFEGSNSPAGFELRVQIGPEYQVAFWPERDEIPPWFGTWKVGGPVEGWSVLLPAESSLVRVRGRLRVGDAAPIDCAAATAPTLPACDGECEGLSDIRVMLRDPSGRVRSNRVVTNQEGAFELLIDSQAGSARLALFPNANAGVAPRATLSFAIDLDAMRKKSQLLLDLGDIVVAAKTKTADVKIVVRDEESLPVAGAEVRVRRDRPAAMGCLPGAKGGLTTQPIFDGLHYEVFTTTDIEGVADLHFFVGPADIAVTPTPHHSAASRLVAALPLNTAPAAVICAARQAWSGRVIDFNQAPQAGASVRLEPVVTPSVGAKAGGKVGVGVVEVLTDDNGLFTVRLDPGRYAVIVDPPLGVGLARALMKVIDIDGEHEPLGGDLVLPAPAVIDGRVVDQYGLPVFGVLVDVIAPQLNGLVPTARHLRKR
jgi:hypothetical protein